MDAYPKTVGSLRGEISASIILRSRENAGERVKKVTKRRRRKKQKRKEGGDEMKFSLPAVDAAFAAVALTGAVCVFRFSQIRDESGRSSVAVLV